MADPRRYWDSVADSAVFTHPLDTEMLRRLVGSSARILDFGCGYGRLLDELRRAGFRNIEGVDASEAMVKRARRLVPDVPVSVCSAPPTFHADASFDAVLLFALLTCIPDDEDQRSLIDEVLRLLAPGGIVYVSDLLLHSDQRSLDRYRANRERMGTFGVFEGPGGMTFRHHDLRWVRALFRPFEPIDLSQFPVTTMLGNPATGFRFLGRRRA